MKAPKTVIFPPQICANTPITKSILPIFIFSCTKVSMSIWESRPRSNATQHNPTQSNPTQPNPTQVILPLLSVSLCRINYSLSNKLSLSPPSLSQRTLWLTRTDRDITSIIMDSDRGGGQQANWIKPVGCPIHRGWESGLEERLNTDTNSLLSQHKKNMAWDLQWNQ